MASAGYGKGYRYVHDDPAARQAMTCLPDGLADRSYVDPDELGGAT
jgi:putative ATPase